ncbi:MAG TPA: alpha/beta hydrolase [Anaeromyxobacteraceae bacterium]
MALARLHRALDALAVWSEDLVRRPPEACRLAASTALDAFGPLPPLGPAPERPGWWTTPSPRPLAPGDALAVHRTPATSPRRGTALLVPPWKIRRPALVGGYVQLLARAGQEVWLVCPPHHLLRTRPGARSGDGYVTLDLAQLRAVVEQQVVELRACAALAASRGPVGIVGLSLGALAAALAATAPEPLAYAALVAPPELALVLSTGIGRRYRRLSDAAGAAWPGEGALADALAPFDARRRAPTARRLFVAGARHDAIAPVAGAEALARAWGVEPRLYPRAHLSLLFLCRALRRDLAGFVSPTQ